MAGSPRRYAIHYYSGPERRADQRVTFYSDAETPALAYDHLVASNPPKTVFHGASLRQLTGDEWLHR